MNFKTTIELEIEDDFLDDDETIETVKADLVGELIKVKSGRFENVASGWIESITENTEQRPE